MRRFGTDGVRGTWGVEPIATSSMVDLALAISVLMHQRHEHTLVIARDTRSSGVEISRIFIKTLLSSGIDVYDVSVLPTGVLAWLTVHLQCDVGIMVTASHNPSSDNGIKFLNSQGSKWDVQHEQLLQDLWSTSIDNSVVMDSGKYQLIDHAYEPYLEALILEFPLLMKKLSVVVDLAHGAACPFLVEFLHSRGCDVIAINHAPNGENINESASCLMPDLLKQCVLDKKADLGIALDGDADRLVVVDHTGQLWDGDALLYLLVCHDQTQGYHHEGVVITSMSNEGLVDSLADMNVATHRSDVGDKFVSRALQLKNWQLGGEPCGHMIDRRCSEVSDPFSIMLRVLSWMVHHDAALASACRPKCYPQKTASIVDCQMSVVQVMDYAQAHYSYVRWVIRPSGTEPVLRMMGEYKDQSTLDDAFYHVLRFANNGIE